MICRASTSMGLLAKEPLMLNRIDLMAAVEASDKEIRNVTNHAYVNTSHNNK